MTMFLPRFITTRTQRSIKFIGTKTWNNIPHDVKKSTHSKFKLCYKKTLVNTYNPTPHLSHLLNLHVSFKHSWIFLANAFAIITKI